MLCERALVLALALTACAPDATAIRATPLGAPVSEPVLLAAAGARHLPAGTAVVVTVAAPAVLIDAAHLGAAFEAAHEPYDRAGESMALWATGLTSLRAAGLDANGPWGMAWLDDASVVFGRVTHSRKLHATLEMAGLPRNANEIHARCVADSALHVVVKKELAYFVHSSDCEGKVAAQVASTDKGLAARPAFQKHLEQLSFGAHAVAYIQPSAWKAWTKGAVFDRLADDYRGRAELSKKIKRVLAARSRAVQRMAKAIDGIAVGVEIDPAGVRIKAFIAGADELITGPSDRHLDPGDARFAFQGTVDPAVFRELFALLGRDPVAAELDLSDVDLSVDKDILPHLDGRIRVRSRPSSLVLRLGLRDPAEARASLRSWVERRRAKPPRSTRALTVSADERVLHIRDADVWLAIEGDELAIVRREKTHAEHRALPDPWVSSLARIDRPDAVLLVDARLVADLLERVRDPFPGILRFGHRRFFTRDEFFSHADRFSGPRSAKHGELVRQAFGLANRQAIERETGGARLLTALGESVLVARIVEGGVMLHGVQRLDDDLSTVVEQLIWAFADAAGTSDTGRQLTQLKRDILALER